MFTLKEKDKMPLDLIGPWWHHFEAVCNYIFWPLRACAGHSFHLWWQNVHNNSGSSSSSTYCLLSIEGQ